MLSLKKKNALGVAVQSSNNSLLFAVVAMVTIAMKLRLEIEGREGEVARDTHI